MLSPSFDARLATSSAGICGNWNRVSSCALCLAIKTAHSSVPASNKAATAHLLPAMTDRPPAWPMVQFVDPRRLRETVLRGIAMHTRTTLLVR